MQPFWLGARPLGGGRTGWVRAAAPAGWQGRAALPWDPPLPPRRGYRLRPIWVGRRGDLQGAIDGGAFVVCSSIEIHPVRGGGRAGGGDGGTVRHRSRLGAPEQGRGLQGAIDGGAFVECSHFGWEPTPWGEGARDGCGRQPLRDGEGGRLCRGTRPCHPAGATDCAQYGWGRGGTMRQKGICAPELRGRRGLTCDMRDYRSR